MTTHIALLRGINVGKHNQIPMADLRALLTDLGFDAVRTHLRSGNVILGAPDRPKRVAERMEAAIAETFGFPIKVVVRSREELAMVIERDPFAGIATDPARYLVGFCDPAPKVTAVGYEPDAFLPERFALDGATVYFWHPNGVQNSAMAKALTERRLGVTVTARNWNTVTKLLALAAD